MARNNDLLKDIVWGNKLFVNAQFVIGLVNKITNYSQGETRLEIIFSYANAIKKQKKIKLYKEVKKEVDEIIFLENEIKEGIVSLKNKDLIAYVLTSTVTVLTTKITRKG